MRLPGQNNWSENLEFLVDTGYSGDVLLNPNKFEEYNYDILKVHSSEGETVDGTIVRTRSITSILKIGNYIKEVNVESIIGGNDENLVGFTFLLDIIATFDGPNNILTFIKN